MSKSRFALGGNWGCLGSLLLLLSLLRGSSCLFSLRLLGDFFLGFLILLIVLFLFAVVFVIGSTSHSVLGSVGLGLLKAGVELAVAWDLSFFFFIFVVIEEHILVHLVSLGLEEAAQVELTSGNGESHGLRDVDVEVKSDLVYLILLQSSNGEILKILAHGCHECDFSAASILRKGNVAQVENGIVVFLECLLSLVWLVLLDYTTPEHLNI